MPNSLNQLEFKCHHSSKKIIGKISEIYQCELDTQIYAIKTYYDSFDWRLFRAGLICKLYQSKNKTQFILTEIKSGNIVVSYDTDIAPVFSHDVSNIRIRKIFEPILEMRALLPITTLDYCIDKFIILNKDQKTVLRLTIETYDLFNNRILLEPIKGYEKPLLQVKKVLLKAGLKTAKESILIEALKEQGRKPLDYSGKIQISLASDMRADVAVKYIFSHLLKIIKLNEQGVISDSDSEFLHDFRVAIRKTRSGLSQLNEVLPAETNAQFSQFFSWLGQLTNQCRDLDVYLLSFNQYKQFLPPSLRNDLDPLHEFLKLKKVKAQKILATQLKSQKYRSPLIQWEEFLKTPAIKKPLEKNAELPIKCVSDRRIWKTYIDIVKHGNRITDSSPPGDLHDLRKRCKKLRYLLEFFQTLYADSDIKPLIKRLKNFQEILGDFQDLEVQEQTLKKISEEMMQQQIPANTFLAMGVLIQALNKQRDITRQSFAEQFKIFQQDDNKLAYKKLFKNSK